MGGIHAHIGFLGEEDALKGVDKDFRGLVRLSYAIQGFGSYGVSCSGHFNPPEAGEKTFWPLPWGSLGVAALPQMKHIPGLLRLIVGETEKDPDARVSINEEKGAPINWKRYNPDTYDLSKYSVGFNKEGLYVALLEIRLGDNGCLETVPDHLCSPILLEGNQIAYEKSQQRYVEIRNFWQGLERQIRAYNAEHNFLKADFSKQEFLPFC